MALLPVPLPQPNLDWIDRSGLLTQWAYQYMSSLDRAVRSFFGGANAARVPIVGPLIDAANDAAAAVAGVPVGGLYRTANAVMIRLV